MHIHIKLYKHSPNSPRMYRKASPRQAPACIISCIVLFVSPFANNLHNTCAKHKKAKHKFSIAKKSPCILHDLFLVIYLYCAKHELSCQACHFCIHVKLWLCAYTTVQAQPQFSPSIQKSLSSPSTCMHYIVYCFICKPLC